jgi:hypothetical protein
MAKKTTGTARARGAGQRDLVKAPNATFYAKRTAGGQFKEMDEVGRSQRTDRARAAKRTVKAGFWRSG